jgi:iron-sulfur cluster repair protein YtfE (RIC family)
MTEIDHLALAHREGLPDALRILLQDYPRETWQAHPNFGGLVAFWLDRHLMFRRLDAMLTDAVQQALDRNNDPQNFARNLSRFGGMLLEQLHGHHMIEDQHYFPLLVQREPKLERGFDILDRDHHALDPLLTDFATAANGAITGALAGKGPDAIAPLEREMARLSRLLDRHLQDEEELVVPVILKFGPSGLDG